MVSGNNTNNTWQKDTKTNNRRIIRYTRNLMLGVLVIGILIIAGVNIIRDQVESAVVPITGTRG